MNRYQAVLFDLDDTLCFSRPSYREVTRRVLADLGYTFPQKRWRALWRWSHAFWASSPELKSLKERFADDPEGFWRAWNERKLRFLGVPQDDIPRVLPALQEAMQTWAEQSESWVPEEVLHTLARLREQGLRLGLVTNRSQSLEPDFLDRIGLAPYFDTVVVAADVGIWKPDPRIFHLTLERLGASPEAAVHVGDNYFADVQGARKAGLTALLFDPHDLFPELPIPRLRRLPHIWEHLDGRT